MKYTARDESQVANIAQGEYLSQNSHQDLFTFIQMKCFIVIYTYSSVIKIVIW